MRLFLPVFALLAVLLIIAGGYWLFFHEDPVAQGPLSEALMEAREPGENGQYLDAVFARFVPEDAPLAEREPLLTSNGFDCHLRPATVAGSTVLSCFRPAEGTRYCEGFFYYSYAASDGSIVETAGSTYVTHPSDRILGLCRPRTVQN